MNPIADHLFCATECPLSGKADIEMKGYFPFGPKRT
jgi:hypothetical protein